MHRKGSNALSISLYVRVVHVLADEAQVYILIDGRAESGRMSIERKYACNIEGKNKCNT